jgi:ribose-phosphate pyrophosphokinase
MRRFPDGETYVRIRADVRDQAIVVVCTLKDPNAHLLPLVFIADTLREFGARQVGLVAPYLAYMRQDKRFQSGEAVTSVSFARLLSKQFDWLTTIDPHLHRLTSLGDIYSIPTAVVRAAPLLTKWIRTHVASPLLVGPDSESEQWVRAVAEAIPAPSIILQKTRHGDRSVSIAIPEEIHRWRQRTPVLVDDIISSAETMSETVRQWLKAGLAAPVCVGVHAVFAAQAFEALRAAGASRIVTTNAIAHSTSEIDVSDALLDPVRRLIGHGTT